MSKRKQFSGGGGEISYTNVTFYIITFVLYVLCFVALFNPNLEIIGFGLLFVLQIILTIGMIYNILSNTDDNNKNTKFSPETFVRLLSSIDIVEQISRMFNPHEVFKMIKIEEFTKSNPIIRFLNNAITNAFKEDNSDDFEGDIIKFLWQIIIFFVIIFYILFIATVSLPAGDANVKQLLMALLTFGPIALILIAFITIVIKVDSKGNRNDFFKRLLYSILDFVKLSFAVIIIPVICVMLLLLSVVWLIWMILYSPFIILSSIIGNWKYQTIIPFVLIIGLVLFLVSMIIMTITIIKLHSRHTKTSLIPQPEFIPSQNTGVIGGYHFDSKGSMGSGYYLDTGGGSANFFMNNPYATQTKDTFKVVATSVTMMILVEFIGYKHYDLIFDAISKIVNPILPNIDMNEITNDKPPFRFNLNTFFKDRPIIKICYDLIYWVIKNPLSPIINGAGFLFKKITYAEDINDITDQVIFKPALIIDMFSIAIIYGILILSSVSIWETQYIGSIMGAVSDPPGATSSKH